MSSSRRIEAEERALDAAEMVVTSTRQEVDGQWGLYDGWDQRLANALAKDPSIKGRYMPRMHVNPPGLDFASAAGSTKGEDSSSFGYELSRNRSESDIHGSVSYSEQVKPSIWTSIERFLDNPRKPAILALARPEAKKNLTAVIKAFGTYLQILSMETSPSYPSQFSVSYCMLLRGKQVSQTRCEA